MNESGKFDIVSFILHFMLGSLLGALLGLTIYPATTMVLSDSPELFYGHIGIGAIGIGALAGFKGERFWNYLKNTFWWRV